MGTFSIRVDNLQWIDGKKDDPFDLCLHGDAVATIGERVLKYHATVSATALYLLKTLTEDHIIYEDNQMLPCCGFSLFPNEAADNVVIIGCDNGIDWTVKHEGEEVVLILEDGTAERVPFAAYEKEVYAFADEIEAYYRSCSPKQVSEDPWEEKGYTAFWKEWHRRRGKNDQ